MQLARDIRRVGDIVQAHTYDIPLGPGVYAFWWIGPRNDLLSASTHIVLSGPGGRDVDVHFEDWWPSELAYPCLYIGKSTNLRKRFGLHLMRGSTGRVHVIPKTGRKQKAATTSCQLRYGIEHIFPRDQQPLRTIEEHVGYSYEEFPAVAIAKRFYREDLLIGTWRPWFNVDSER